MRGRFIMVFLGVENMNDSLFVEIGEILKYVYKFGIKLT